MCPAGAGGAAAGDGAKPEIGRRLSTTLRLGEHKPGRIKPGRTVSKGPLYPSNTKIIFLCFLIRPRSYASDTL